MKKICKFLFVFVCVLACVSPILINETNFVKSTFADGVVEEIKNISLASDLIVNDDFNMGGSFVLTDDLEVSNFIPIGDKTQPFTGIFNGNGKTIKINSFGEIACQALFAYCEDATIFDLKIEIVAYNFSNSIIEDMVLAGIIANDKGSALQNCEVDFVGEDIVNNLSVQLVAGGLIGEADGSVILDCVSYNNFNLNSLLTSDSTVVLGGIVGKANQNLIIRRAASFTNINYVENNQLSTQIFAGGLIGSVGIFGNNFQVQNCVSATQISILDSSQNQLNIFKTGSVVGKIIQPNTAQGCFKSVAYIQENIDEIGEGNGYQVLLADQIKQVPNDILTIKTFYTNLENSFVLNDVTQTFSWANPPWDFQHIFMIANEGIRLQEFQLFKISFETEIDSRGLLEEGDVGIVEGGFSQEAIIDVVFIDPNQAQLFEISAINLNGNQIDLVNKTDKTEDDVIYFEVLENGYKIYAILSSQTVGKYSFDLKATEFSGKINTALISTDADGNEEINFADVEGCGVSFYNTIGDEKTFSANKLETSVNVNTGTQYYNLYGWNLFYENELGEFDVDGVKYENAGFIFNNSNLVKDEIFEIDFGQYQQNYVLINSSINDHSLFNQNTMFFNQNFMLVAVFKQDPYCLNFKIDDDMQDCLSSFTVSRKNSDIVQDVFQNQDVLVGKDDEITITLKVKKGFLLDDAKFIKNIKANSTNSNFLINDEFLSDENKYLFTFKTNKLTKNEDSLFELAVPLLEDQGANNNLLWLWILLASVGTVLCIGIILLIIFVRRKRGFSVKNSSKISSDDYKKYL